MDDVRPQFSWHDLCINTGLNPLKQPVVLAVSGGVDSMAMAHILHQFWAQCQSEPKSLRALIIDHGIRANSAHEAALTAQRLTAFGIPNRIERLAAPAPETGIQAWARDHRYQALWREACRDQAVIVTWHHKEDQAETMMMRLSKGSGIKGLAGMKLQSDPTTLYGLQMSGTPVKRLLRRHLSHDSLWNTYKYKGLPPTPITNPGTSSLHAVLNPDKSDYLYFVANGKGGHNFAKTLDEHNKNVRAWRKIQKNQD